MQKAAPELGIRGGIDRMSSVVAIRIYYGDISMTPYADIRMADGVIETICWVNIKERKKFEGAISGYTLIYDEREKRKWEEWL